MKKQILISLAILAFLIIGTTIAILYAKGYRFSLLKGKPEFSGTGLLVATSQPDGAQVFINGHLTTATDNTINLPPGEYSVKIFKEGYFPWEKKIKIQKEVVSKAEGLLLPNAPKLENITASGVQNPSIDPSQTRLAYTVASQSARKNGIYILDMTNRPILTLQSAATQIADDTVDAFSISTLSWSPDGKQLLGNVNQSIYLLQAGSFNQNPQDVTPTLASVQALWEEDKKTKEEARLTGLKPVLKKFIVDNFTVIAWSPDETKILYEASQSANMPIIIKPRLIGVDSTPEERTIKKGRIYVYDLKEDKNFKILDSLPNPQLSITDYQLPLSWFPDSKHLIYVHDKKIDLMEYDGLNLTTVYAGPFEDNYVFPWTNGSKIVILTNLGNPNIVPNLYTIGLK